jgi:hypothetical protein
MPQSNLACRRLLAAAVLLSLVAPAGAAESPSLGTMVSPTASLIRREGKTWKVVPEKGSLHAGELVIGAPSAIIDTPGGIRLQLLAELDKRSPYPVIESGIKLNPTDKADASFTLDRGRVIVSNRKESGKATVEIRVHEHRWTLHLPAGARAAMEVYGRLPAGSVFKPNAKDLEMPACDFILVVVHGEALLDADGNHFRLHAPPGKALIRWDNGTGWDDEPTRLEKVPAWGVPIDLDTTPEIKQRMERLHKLLTEKPVETVIETFLHSDNPNERRTGINSAAAIDRLDLIGDVLMKTQNQDVWDNTALALRNWLGRGPGQDQRFYEFLVKERNCTPAHAEIILQLTRGFGDDDLACPDCYEMLIDYLKHEKQAIRGFAQWHLHRLVPAGRDIKFNPAGPPEEWEKAYKAWKKLIPDGKMPPKEKPGK